MSTPQQDAAYLDRVGIPATTVAAFMVGDATNIVGRHMNTATNNTEAALNTFKQATDHLFAASERLHAQMDALSKRAKDSVARAKDQTAQMSDAMNKITKVLGPDFEKRLNQLEQLTTCLERLNELQSDGKLQKLMEAMK